jgi:hypothetical protein
MFCTTFYIASSHPIIDCRENHREMHGAAMVDPGANLEQEASVHV